MGQNGTPPKVILLKGNGGSRNILRYNPLVDHQMNDSQRSAGREFPVAREAVVMNRMRVS